MTNCFRFVLLFAISKLFLMGFAICSFGSEPSDLQGLLKQEASGMIVDRSIATGDVPADAFSAWQAGMVKQDNEWKSISELQGSQKESRYLAKREELAQHDQRHRMLAKWCVTQQMPERARAHYYAILSSSPNDMEARSYLGHALVGGEWVDKGELAKNQGDFQARFKTLDVFGPKVSLIVSGLHSGNSKRMSKALQALGELNSENALLALELFASNVDDDLAKPLIRKIASGRSRESCLALVRIALAHPSQDIRSVTAEEIRKYPKAHYVPELLNMLVGELEVENQLVRRPNGTVALETLFRIELRDKKQVQRSQQFVSVVSEFSSHHSSSIFRTTQADMSYWSEYWKIPKNASEYFGTVNIPGETTTAESSVNSTYIPKEVFEAVAGNLDEQSKQQERAVAKSNRDQREMTSRICALLRATTGTEIEDKPNLWWSWWNEYNERYQSEKPTSFVYSSKTENVVVASATSRQEVTNTVKDAGHMLVQWSCLVPGTVVHTSAGLVPIEKVQGGDLVLSHDVETAELTLKPVLMTTVRPPKSTIKMVTSQGTIEATAGHLWWACGLGWMKTRDLKPGMTLRTATGSSILESLEVNPTPQTTHNLVVDGFHTYFVGQERVLSYDNSSLKPTLRQLPGYGKTNDLVLD